VTVTINNRECKSSLHLSVVGSNLTFSRIRESEIGVGRACCDPKGTGNERFTMLKRSHDIRSLNSTDPVRF
jgi:hypothetical protein